MSDAVIIEIVRAVPVIISAFLSLVAAMLSFNNRKKIEDLHVAVNGRLSQLLELTAKSSKAEGKFEGSVRLEP